MFQYMGITKENKAIFLDFEKNDFSFLIKIAEEDNQLVISHFYRDCTFNAETINIGVPQNKQEEARNFLNEATAYTTPQNPQFMLALEEYKQELAQSLAAEN